MGSAHRFIVNTWSQVASVIVIVIGGLALVGWAFDIPLFKSILPGLTTLKANTAIAFILIGAALWLLRDERFDLRKRRLAQLSILLVFLIAFLTLTEYIFGWNLGIDQLIFRDTASAFFPGRMARASAFGLLILSIALWRLNRHPLFTQLCALVVIGVALLALAGYLYGVAALYGVSVYGAVSLSGAFAFLIVGSGILLARPYTGLMTVITSYSPGGVFARRLLPAVILVPLFIGWLRLKGQQRGLYGTEFGLALFALSNIIILTILVWWIAALLNKADAKRKQDEARIHKLNRSLSVLSDINQAIVRIRDLPMLFEQACRIAVEKGSFRMALVGMLDPKKTQLKAIASAGVTDQELSILIEGLNGDAPIQHPFAIPLRAGERWICNDIKNDPQMLPWHEGAERLGYQAAAGFPLIVSGEVRGALKLYAEESNFFDPEELKLLDEMAGDIAFAITFAEQETQRAEAAMTIQRYAQRMEILHQLDLGLIQGGSIQTLVEVTLKHLRRLIPCQRADVTLLDEAANEALVFAVGLDGDTKLGSGVRVPIPPNVFEGYDERHLRVFEDIRLFQEARPRAKQLVNEGLLSALSVILMDGDHPIGVLGLFASTSGFFTAEHQEIVTEIASQLTLAVRQMRLSEALSQYAGELEEKVLERTAALTDIKERVEAILNNSLDAILLVHKDLSIQQTNAAFNNLIAASPADYFDRSLLDFIHPDDAHRVKQIVETGLTEHMGNYLEIRIRRQDGTEVEAELSIGYVNAEDKEAESLVCTIRDITERKRNAAALEEQRTFLRKVIDASPSMIFVKDYNARFVLANTVVAQTYNTTVEDLIGKRDADFSPSLEETQEFLAADRQVIDSGEVLFLEEPVTSPNGETRWFQTTKVPIVSVDGKSKYVLGIATDITERKQTEAEVREQHNFLQHVINSVPGLIIVKDHQGRFQLVNRLLAQIYDTAPEDMIGKTDADFNPNAAEVEFYLQKDRETLESHQPIFIPEETVLNRYYQTSKIPLMNARGEYDRLLVVASDITERKKAEAELQQAYEKEKEISELKSRFVSMASHEFRTPLATILALSETLMAYREKLSGEQIEQRLGKIQFQIGHLKDIMDDVLQLARLQARRFEFNPVTTNLDALCRSVLDEFESQPSVAHTIAYTCDDVLREVYLDTKLMRQIISNLVSNAIKYSPQDKPIEVTLKYIAHTLVLSVSDHGIGIPEADLKHLFEPFHRAANVGTISGTGLGLIITKESVELHGGTIAVESQVDAGTTFTVTIPLGVKGEEDIDEDTGD